jgi:hypothetical protein
MAGRRGPHTTAVPVFVVGREERGYARGAWRGVCDPDAG